MGPPGSARRSRASAPRLAEGPDDLAAALRLRERVFCGEQGVDREEEFDGHDADAVHVVVEAAGELIGTCRLLFEASGECRLGRMAVDAGWRGQGIGAAILELAERIAAERGAERIVLNAQRTAEPFYAGGGYVAEGETFVEAGIDHVRMRKELD